MANKTLIDIALRLAKELGANTSKFLGTRSNVSFLGSGPQDGMLFQEKINPEMISVIGQEKIIPAIESSMSYATGGKLNDLQLNKLIDNMTVMKETLNPTNILKGDFGIDSLRAKSGIGERQLSEAAGDVKSIDEAAAGVNVADDVSVSGNQFLDKFSEIKNRPAGLEETAPLMSRLENRIGNIKNETEQASAIMETIPKVDLPGKRASAREFLVNALKEGDGVNASRTVFGDIVSPQDMKYIMEGGGGVDADPIVLIQKYFGPRVAEMMPVGATTEQMAILTKRILENSTDAKGLRPTDQGFDKYTLKLQESVKETPDGFPFAHGGRAGFQGGGMSMGNAENQAQSTAMAGSGLGGDLSTPTQDYFHNKAMEHNVVPNTGDGGTGGITAVIDAPVKLGVVDRFKNYIFGSNDDDNDPAKVSLGTGLAEDAKNQILANKEATAAADIWNEYKAEGGIAGLDTRQGYRFGGSSKILKRISNKMIKKAADDIFPTDDYKYDAEMVVDALVENNPIIFKNMLADDLDDALRSDLYGLAVRETGLRVGAKIKARKSIIPDNEYVQVKKDFNQEILGETPKPRFQLNVEKAVSELNIPREEAMRIAQLPPAEQKLALQMYLDRSTAQGVELMNYNPRKFDAAHGGLAKILEV